MVSFHPFAQYSHHGRQLGLPHDIDDTCTKIGNLPCDPGYKVCVLAGRYVFADEAKNAHLREKAMHEAHATDVMESRWHP